MVINNYFDKFHKEQNSEFKKTMSAIVTSNITYKTKNKKFKKFFKPIAIFYMILIVIISSFSFALSSLNSQEKQENAEIVISLEIAIFFVLVFDIILRWYTSDVRLKKGKYSYFLFPLTFTGIILIISLLPSLYIVNVLTNTEIEIFSNLKNIQVLRVFRLMLLANAVIFSNLIPGLAVLKRVIIKEKSTLYTIFVVVIIAIIAFSFMIYSAEGETNEKINNLFDAVYFATVSLTTIGFGDITPVTESGKMIVIFMSIFGVAILATPSGVISGGFISELKSVRSKKDKKE